MRLSFRQARKVCGEAEEEFVRCVTSMLVVANV